MSLSVVYFVYSHPQIWKKEIDYVRLIINIKGGSLWKPGSGTEPLLG